MLHIPRHFRPTFDHISDIHFPTFINIFITFNNIPAPPPTINPILNNIVSNLTIYNITLHITLHFKIRHHNTSHHYKLHDIEWHHSTLHHITQRHITSHHRVSYHSSKLYDCWCFCKFLRPRYFCLNFVILQLSLPGFWTWNPGEKRQIIDAQLSWLKHATFVIA